MSASPEKFTLPIEVVPALADQQSVIADMLQFYIRDFSLFHPVEPDADGHFAYPQLPLYWSEPDRRPFLIQVAGAPAGFVFVKRVAGVAGAHSAWDVAEFFVAHAHRRQGIGVHAAHQLWRKFPGSWQVRVMQSNRGALEFWQHAITTFLGQPIHPARLEINSALWNVFIFESKLGMSV
jgi:predicted acetyltransferase